MEEQYSDQSDGAPEQVGTEQRDSLPIDERFEILKNERRRIVLEYLDDAEGTIQLDELADHVTAVENDTEIAAITSSERKRVYVGLYQFHLPKMSRMGVIEYDQDRGDITLTELGQQLYTEHEADSDPRKSWWSRYLAVGIFGLASLGIAVLTQSWPVAVVLLGLQTGTLLSIGLYHWSRVRSGNSHGA